MGGRKRFQEAIVTRMTPQPPDAQSLIERAKQRDESAFLELMKRYVTIIINIIRRYIHNILGYEEDDLMQEIQLRAFRVLPKFEGDEISFECWLRRSSKGLCLNILDKQRRHEVVALETVCQETMEKGLDNPIPDPETAFTRVEIQARVQQALAALAEDMKTVVILKDLEGLGYEEIAQLLGIKIGTVQSRLHRGRMLLREQLRMLR